MPIVGLSRIYVGAHLPLDVAGGQHSASRPQRSAGPLLIRDRRVVRTPKSPATVPVGFGGATPQISEQVLRPGDRVLFFTDGAIEEHKPGWEQFGQKRLIEFTERAGRMDEGVQEMVRNLSRSLVQARGGVTTDDATSS